MFAAMTEVVLGQATLEPLSPIDSMVRMILACLLGALIGMERQVHGRAAGLDPHPHDLHRADHL